MSARRTHPDGSHLPPGGCEHVDDGLRRGALDPLHLRVIANQRCEQISSVFQHPLIWFSSVFNIAPGTFDLLHPTPYFPPSLSLVLHQISLDTDCQGTVEDRFSFGCTRPVHPVVHNHSPSNTTGHKHRQGQRNQSVSQHCGYTSCQRANMHPYLLTNGSSVRRRGDKELGQVDLIRPPHLVQFLLPATRRRGMHTPAPSLSAQLPFLSESNLRLLCLARTCNGPITRDHTQIFVAKRPEKLS